MSLVGFICGVPDLECSGGKLITDQHLGHKKYHTTRLEAFNCMKNHLLSTGFTQVGSREFLNPENNYVRVLPKKSKFGGALRWGKEKSRRMPAQFSRGMISSI